MIKTDKWNFDDVDGEKMEGVMKFWDMGPMVVTGCTKVSEGCLNCWSETAHNRRCHNPAVEHLYRKWLLTDGRFNGRVQFNLQQLEKAVKVKKPQVIAIWNDLYHEALTVEQIGQAHRIMANKRNAHHTFLIVTKRADRAADYCQGVSDISGGIQVPDNMWHLITCENQKRLDERTPHILRIPGKRGVLIEPMLEAIDFEQVPTTRIEGKDKNGRFTLRKINHIHQVILGPENGSNKRPFDPAWAESVKAQCEAAGVPFYRKDTGEGTLAWRI